MLINKILHKNIIDVVVKDIVNLTRTKMITEFVSEETLGKKLAQNRHYNC